MQPSMLISIMRWRCSLFSSVYFWFLVKNQSSIMYVIMFLSLIWFHCLMCLFACWYSVIQFKICDGNSSRSSFIFLDFFYSYPELSFFFGGGRGFNMKLKTDFLFSVQNFVGCFIVLFLETVSLMCFSVSQLFVYRNSTDICVNFISHYFSESVDQL